MKNFIFKTSTFCILLIVFFISIILVRSYYIKSISWKLPKDKHIVFMGASHIQAGINPNYYPSAINVASSSERYMFTYLKLLKLVSDNPQIDTIFLQFAPTDIQPNTDSKYFQKNEMTHFIPLYYPFFSGNEWRIYSNNMNAFHILVKKSIANYPTSISDFGGYKEFNIFFDRNKPTNMPIWKNVGHSINYSYLDKIINICKVNNIELVFIYMPMYNKKHFYDTSYFYKIYQLKYSKIPFLDYSDWTCPDTYRKDEHHLNKKGAIVFTKQLYYTLKARTHNNIYKSLGDK